MTYDEFHSIIDDWVDEIVQMIVDGDVNKDEPHDAVSDMVDSGWAELGFPYGRIDEWPVNPGGNILRLLGDVLEWCENDGCLEDDHGLWNGLSGAAMLGAQAFFSIEQEVWEKLSNALLDYVECDNCNKLLHVDETNSCTACCGTFCINCMSSGVDNICIWCKEEDEDA